MKPRLILSQAQKQVLAPVMQQSIHVLLLPVTDLEAAIELELQNNPLLEAVDQSTSEDSSLKKSEDLQKRMDDHADRREPFPYQPQSEDDEESEEKPVTKEQTLEEYLLRQLELETSDPAKLKIGEIIIGNIDEDGYLKISCEEIGLILGVPEGDVESTLSLIQSFDPIGVAARNLKECILIQLKAKNQNGDITTAIVNGHLEDLGKKRFHDIARALDLPVEKVKETAHKISLLDPKPARNYRPVQSGIYIKPDVFISHDAETGYNIYINDSHIPRLHISTTYKNMLARPDLKEDERNFIREKLENALCFIKSIEQRGQTLKEITKYILNRQKNFFEGDHLALVPLTLKDVAEALGRNESTVSRAVNNKYVDTPQGLFPLKYFFSQSLPSQANGCTCSQSIKEEIKDIIGHEDKLSPLSDQDIQSHFNRKGVHLARRTIAKYREALQIPASYLRKDTPFHKN